MDGHVAKPFTRESLAGALECAAEAGRRRAVRDAEAAPSGPLPPVLDIGVFERTAAVLTPDDVRFHMGTLAARGEALLHGLRGSSLSVATGGDLAEAAHALAGSAGLFGFARLASVARRFEDAAESLAAEVPTAARDLAAALETALDEMHSRGPALMEA
jgi:HPt (histidine-containing phosphotransfer) domain-containing protein